MRCYGPSEQLHVTELNDEGRCKAPSSPSPPRVISASQTLVDSKLMEIQNIYTHE